MGSKKKKGASKEENPVVENEQVREEQEETPEAPGTPEPPEEAGPEEAAGEAGAQDEEKEQLKDQLMRTLAEYDNFRKRSAKEKETLFADGKAYAVEALLAVADNFERALTTESSDGEFKKGMEMIFKQMQESFSKLGVTEIEAQGQPFDPQLHNAVMHIEDENLPENTVAQVFQKGYKMGEKVIRHAMVQVAN